MGCTGSKRPVSTPADRQGEIKQHRKKHEQYDSRKVPSDAVKQSRPTRFFNVTKDSVEATVTFDRKAVIRAYLEPDGGGEGTEVIELECEADVDHYLLYENLRPGTLYRLKLFYVAGGRAFSVRPPSFFLGSSAGARQKPDTRTPSLAAAGGGYRVSRSGDAALPPESIRVRRRTLTCPDTGDVPARRQMLPGLPTRGDMVPVVAPFNYPKTIQVRTLPADWAEKASLRRSAVSSSGGVCLSTGLSAGASSNCKESSAGSGLSLRTSGVGSVSRGASELPKRKKSRRKKSKNKKKRDRDRAASSSGGAQT